ncbi:MAG: hypothetical protein SFV24_06190 [Gemmatimonadales bacterium]|nr:hypothetical protein [Gemmatimonadota bacterium]MCC7131975.1 hypothetical protein [Gemmatimonadales bacterium]MDX2057373.1 hypothetical protein [Gemmatimonadales bacterium]
MTRTVARHTVSWCNRSIEWAAVAVEDDVVPAGPRNAVWSYRLDGLTYFGFPFDPVEETGTTRQRALNWLNRHHLIVRREHLVADLKPSLR